MVVLFALAYVGAVALTGRRPVASALAFVAPLGLITGSAYVAVGMTFGFFHDPAGFFRWTTTAGRTGYWGPLGRPKLLEGLYGRDVFRDDRRCAEAAEMGSRGLHVSGATN